MPATRRTRPPGTRPSRSARSSRPGRHTGSRHERVVVMPLTSHQIDRLAAAIAAHWAFSGFTMFAKDYWELDPGNLAPNQPLKVQARTFISDLNSRLPPG